MSSFPNWKQFAVHQREELTGCIPTGYEMLLRAAGVEYVDYSTFQEEFDLDLGKKSSAEPENNFNSVANAIQATYPEIKFTRVIFEKGEGEKKLETIETFLENSRFLLVSLTLQPFGGHGWHIMPIVDADNQHLYLLNIVNKDGKPDIQKLRKSEFVQIHDNFHGGNDIAYLESW